MCGVVLHVCFVADCGAVARFCIVFTTLFTAMACYNISLSYEQSGALPRALEAAREALRIWQSTLPPGHSHISFAEELVRHLEVAVR